MDRKKKGKYVMCRVSKLDLGLDLCRSCLTAMCPWTNHIKYLHISIVLCKRRRIPIPLKVNSVLREILCYQVGMHKPLPHFTQEENVDI